MKKWRLIIIITIIALVVFFLSFFKFFDYPKNIFWKMAQPMGTISRLSLGKLPNFFKSIFQLGTIVKQNHSLINENLDLQSRLVKLEEVEYENEILKKELGFAKTQDNTKIIPVAIIGQAPGGYLKSLIIDKGKNDGLETGQGVISQGFLVGTLNHVYQNTAEVTLMTDYNSLVPVVLQNSRGTGLLRGGLSGLTVEDIPLNIGLEKQENVMTSGLGGQIPAGIAVGQVKEIISKEGEIFQKVSVVSPIDFSRMEVLFIIKKND